MTSNIRTLALATLVAVASLSHTLHAQSIAQPLAIHVPFSFDYGSRHFAAGTCVLNRNSLNTLIVRCNGTAAVAMIKTEYDPTPAKSSFVLFKKYGDRYFLQEIHIANATGHLDVYESDTEKRATREYASRGSQPTELAVALSPALSAGN